MELEELKADWGMPLFYKPFSLFSTPVRTIPKDQSSQAPVKSTPTTEEKETDREQAEIALTQDSPEDFKQLIDSILR
ncbi:MAG: hypothetical protein LBQ30_02455 [Treponema sp.]|jgi:hypothetical protein|nr:hypothetical protein [Treponema sp.]